MQNDAPQSPNRHARAQSVSTNPLNPAIGIPGFDARQFRNATVTRSTLTSAAAASSTGISASRQSDNQHLIALFMQMYTQISTLADNYKRDSGGNLEGNDETTLLTLKDIARVIKEAIDKEGPILNIERYTSFATRLRTVQANAKKSKGWFSNETLPTALAGVIGTTIDLLERNKTNYEVELQRAAEKVEQEARRKAEEERNQKLMLDMELQRKRAEEVEEERKRIEAAKEKERQEEAEKRLKDLESRLEARFTTTEAKTAELIAAEKQAREHAEARAKAAEEAARAEREKVSEMENKLVLFNDALGSFKKQFLLIQGPEAKQLAPMLSQLLEKLGQPALPALEAPASAGSSVNDYLPNKHIVVPPNNDTNSHEFKSWRSSKPSQYEQYLLQDCIAKSRFYAICELVDLYNKYKPTNGVSGSLHQPVPEAEVLKSIIHQLISFERWDESWEKSINEVVKPALAKATDTNLKNCLSLIATFTIYTDNIPASYSKLQDRLLVFYKVISQGNFVPTSKELALKYYAKSQENTNTPQQTNGKK